MLFYMTEPKTLREATIFFANPDNCVAYMVERRWPDGVVKCPTCGRNDVSYVSARRVWQCKTRHPKSQFSIKVGTIMEDSALPLDKWLMAMWMVANCKNGVSSWEIHRTIGVTQKSAWFMLHRIRLAMQGTSVLRMGQQGGPVEVDEAFIGGRPKNMHASRRRKLQTHGMHTDKPAVLGMFDRETRQVRAKVIPNVKREVLMNEILDQVVLGSKVFTDAYNGYARLTRENFVHETVSHITEYVRGEVHTQAIENFWSLLKRTLSGTYVSVEPFHLDRYVTEQVFRFNNRSTRDNPLTDSDRFALAVTQILGKRITYKELTGKEAASPETNPF
jgi:transposase-like protein